MTIHQPTILKVCWHDIAWIPNVGRAEVDEPWIAPDPPRYQATLEFTGFQKNCRLVKELDKQYN